MNFGTPALRFVLILLLSLNSYKVFANNFDKAVQAFNQNALNEASIHVRNFLQEEPSDVRGRLLYAEILIMQNRPVEAQRELDTAMEVGASDTQVLELLARTESKLTPVNSSSEATNEESKNSQFVGNIEEIKQQAPEALLAEAIAKYSEQQWFAATIWFNAYLEKRPDDLSALVLLSKSYHMNANPSKALEVLKPKATALRQDKNYAPALALALIETGQYQEAEALLQKQIDTYGNEPHTIMLLSKTYERQDMLGLAYDTLSVLDPETSPQSQQMKMQLAYEMKRYLESLGILRSMIEKKPNDKNLKLFEIQLLWDMGSENEALLNAEALINSSSLLNETVEKAQIMRVELLHGLNKHEERDKEFLVLTNHWKESPEKLIALAQMQTRMGALNQAIKTFTLGIKANPEDEKLALSFISFLSWQKQLAQAEQQLARLDSQNIEDKGSYYKLSGDIKLALGNKTQAYNYYKQAVSYSIEDIGTLYKLSKLSREISESDSFSNLLKEKIAEFPEKVYLLEIIAEHYLEQKLHQDAIFYYGQFLTKRIPQIKRAIGLNNLAHLYNETEKYELGIEHAKQAISLRDDIPTFHDTLGWGYALSGKYAQALVHLKKAYSMAEDSETIRYHLAYTFTKLGKHEEAKQYASKM